MNVFTRGVRNAFRNGIRASAIIGVLGLSIGLSLAMLLANQAVGQKIEEVHKTVGTTITVTPAGIRGFMGGGEPLDADNITAIKETAHVASIDQTLSDRLNSDGTDLESAIEPGSFGQRQMRIERGGDSGAVTFQSDNESSPPAADFKPPILVVGSTNPLASVPSTSGSSAKLTDGKTFDGTKDANLALVGKDLATKNSLKVGSKFTAYSTEFTVAGIYDSGDNFSNNQVLMPLPTVQRLSDQAGAVTSVTAHVDSAVNLEATATKLTNKLGNEAAVSSDAENTKDTLASLENIRSASTFSLIGASAAAAVILLLTMIMIVRERRREIGVLKAIGGSNLRVMGQFAVESLTLTILAATIGIVIGSLAATPVTKMLANTTNETSDTGNTLQVPGGGPVTVTSGPSPRGFSARLQDNAVAQGAKNLKANVDATIVLYGLGSALLIAAIGSTAAAGLIARVRPAEVMRAE